MCFASFPFNISTEDCHNYLCTGKVQLQWHNSDISSGLKNLKVKISFKMGLRKLFSTI